MKEEIGPVSFFLDIGDGHLFAKCLLKGLKVGLVVSVSCWKKDNEYQVVSLSEIGSDEIDGCSNGVLLENFIGDSEIATGGDSRLGLQLSNNLLLNYWELESEELGFRSAIFPGNSGKSGGGYIGGSYCGP